MASYSSDCQVQQFNKQEDLIGALAGFMSQEFEHNEAGYGFLILKDGVLAEEKDWRGDTANIYEGQADNFHEAYVSYTESALPIVKQILEDREIEETI